MEVKSDILQWKTPPKLSSVVQRLSGSQVKNILLVKLASSLHWNKYSLPSPRLQTEQNTLACGQRSLRRLLIPVRTFL